MQRPPNLEVYVVLSLFAAFLNEAYHRKTLEILCKSWLNLELELADN